MADGSRHSMRLVEEVLYGVTPATPTFIPIRHTGTTLGLAKENLQSNELRQDRQIADFRGGAFSVAGDISFELSHASFDEILEGLLGGTWDNDVLTAGVVRRSYTIERFFSDMALLDKPYHRFTGVEFNTLALQVNANAMITGTFGVVGSDMTTDDEPIVDAVYSDPTTTRPMDSFTGQLLEAGSPIAVVTEIALNVNNGLAARYVVGQRNSIRPSIGRSNVTGTLTAYFENSLLLDKFINDTPSSLEFTLPDGAGNDMEFELPRIVYTGGQPDVTGEGPITLSMPFQATLDPVTGTNIIIRR